MRRKKRPRLIIDGCYVISLNGKAIRYVLKRSVIARNIRFEIRQGEGLSIVIPRAYPAERLPLIIGKKQKWILSRLSRLEEHMATQSTGEKRTGDIIPFIGRSLKLSLTAGNTESTTIMLQGENLFVTFHPETERIDSLIRSWYRTQAEHYIRARVQELSTICGVSCKKVTIRSQRTRWGSCSQKGNLSLNWKVIIAPPEVIDYVILHELLHMKEMNHSKRFWKLVNNYCPTWRDHRKWLRSASIRLAEDLPF